MSRFTRRTTLGAFGALGMLSLAGPISHAQTVSRRKFVFILLRGALDGLATLIPDDREMVALRPNILPDLSDRLDLGNGFRLHPSLGNIKSLYDQSDVAFVHAAATTFPERSHFEAQDFLEMLGGTATRDGWINRTLAVTGQSGLAVSQSLPLAMMGHAPAGNWAPSAFSPVSDNLLDRLEDLYAPNPQFAESLAMARVNAALVSRKDGRLDKRAASKAADQNIIRTLQAAGKLLSAPNGPDIVMVPLAGWDTHSEQKRRLTRLLGGLDEGLAAMKQEIEADWDRTCVVICSEFGRTAAQNGTGGTDHGTGGLMMLAGGAVAGGRLHGDWPGLGRSALFEQRDLAPANDVTSVLKGVLRDHLGIDRQVLNTRVIPTEALAMNGLIRS